MQRTILFAALAAAVWAPAEGCTKRPLLEVSGDPSGTAVDQFVQRVNTSATILWVIDNSGSMCEEQFNVRSNIDAFLDAFLEAAPGATFHMGVVDTDTLDPLSSGRLQNSYSPTAATAMCGTPPPPLDCTSALPNPLPKWVDETMIADATIEPIFACLASRGINGFGGETALGAARMALSPELLNDATANAGFYIPGSLVAIVFLGDEDDCSVCSGTRCSPLPNLQSNLECAIDRVGELTPVADFVAAIGALDPANEGTPLRDSGLVVASIIGLDASGSSAGPIIPDPSGADALVPICSIAGQGTAVPAPRIEAFTRAFDDYREYSICDADFGTELADLGRLLGAALNTGCLQNRPCPGTEDSDVVVRVTDALGARELAPGEDGTAGDGDYDVVCAAGAPGSPACPASADDVCPAGWRINFLYEVPRGATVEVIYGFDAGDRCD